MKHYYNALSVEVYKLRRTLASWGIVIGPSVINGLQFMMMLDRTPGNYPKDVTPWLMVYDNTIALWALVMLPLYVALQTALLANLEHATSQWKYLYALPVPRFAYYAAKWTVMMLVIAATNLVLVLEVPLGGMILQWVQPGWTFATTSIPWERVVSGWWWLTAASALMVSVHLFISLNWRSFIPSLGVGLAGAILNIFVASSDRWNVYDLWMMPGLAAMGEPPSNVSGMWIGAGLGMAVAALAGLALLMRQQRRAD